MSDEFSFDSDSGVDAGQDFGAGDAAGDAGHDSGATADPGPDAGYDFGAADDAVDAGHDRAAMTDLGADAGYDFGAIGDAGVDAGHDSAAMTDLGADTGYDFGAADDAVDAGHDSAAMTDLGADTGYDFGAIDDAGGANQGEMTVQSAQDAVGNQDESKAGEEFPTSKAGDADGEEFPTSKAGDADGEEFPTSKAAGPPVVGEWVADAEGNRSFTDAMGILWVADPDAPGLLYGVDADGKTYMLTPENGVVRSGHAFMVGEHTVWTSEDGAIVIAKVNGNLFRSGPDGYSMKYSPELAQQLPGASDGWHPLSKLGWDSALQGSREIEGLKSTEAGRAQLARLDMGLLERLGESYVSIAGYLAGFYSGPIAQILAASVNLAQLDEALSKATTFEERMRIFETAVDGVRLGQMEGLDPSRGDAAPGPHGNSPGPAGALAEADPGPASFDPASPAPPAAEALPSGGSVHLEASPGIVPDALAPASDSQAHAAGAAAAEAAGHGIPDPTPAGSGMQRRELGVNVDEIRSVGEPGITPQEAIHRAMDVVENRQLLDALTNQATKREGAHVPIAHREPQPIVSILDNPHAIVDRPLGEIREYREMAQTVLDKHAASLEGKSAHEVQQILNRALREELKHPKTAPGRELSQALRTIFGAEPETLFKAQTIEKLPWR